MHYYLIQLVYIHDYMGPGYVDAASFWWPLNYFRLNNVFNVLTII